MPPSDNGKWTCIPTVLFQSADHSKRLKTLVTSTHSLTHWRHRLPWGSVSCSAMLWQLGVLDSKQPPSYYWMTCSTSWATTANCTERTFHTSYSKPQAERGPLENAAHLSHTGPFHTFFSRREYSNQFYFYFYFYLLLFFKAGILSLYSTSPSMWRLQRRNGRTVSFRLWSTIGGSKRRGDVCGNG